MVDDAKGEGRDVELAAADGDEITFVDWTYRLLSLERVEADPEEGEDADLFSAKFSVDGPNANAEVEITVSDFADEAHVVSIAQHTLHVAMTMWGRITADRFIRARASDLPKRGTSRQR